MPYGEVSGTRSSVPAGKNKTPGLSTGSVGTFLNVAGVSGELFDAIEVNAARTGNHKRAAVRMSRLAEQATPSDMSRAEAHMRAGEQWMLADEPEEAAGQFREAIADAGPTFDDPRVGLARAMFALGRTADADSLLRQLKESGARSVPRTCDLVAELLTEQGDLPGALDWATAGVDACLSGEDRAELQLLLRLRYRIRVDLGLAEDSYDKMLDTRRAGPAAGS
jgi:tetratricopeptide (TPR) repeat protein